MITSIDKLEKLGIYKDIRTKTIADFKRYNLIYGWNGSGKSTFSRLFRVIGEENVPENFAGLKYTITVDGNRYSERDKLPTTTNIAVFNEDFMNENIEWNGTIKSILLLDEVNIETVKKYNQLKIELYGEEDRKGLIFSVEDEEKNLAKEEAEIQKILTNIGKVVKNNYQLLDTTDSYYLNYDKRKVQHLIENEVTPLTDLDILNSDELERAIKQAKPIKKDAISILINKVELDLIEGLIEQTKELLGRKVASKIIEELRENVDIANWVETGLGIHKSKGLNKCAFCGAEIKQIRMEELEAYFNNALNCLKQEIEQCIQTWKGYTIERQPEYTNKALYYDEFVAEISQLNEKYEDVFTLLDERIKGILSLLESKKNSPFEEQVWQENNTLDIINSFNELCKKYSSIISKHNKKTENFELETKNIKKKIERHYVREQIITTGYDNKKKEYADKSKLLQSKKETLRDKTSEFNRLENQLSNETLGAEEFNEKLQKFLGYDEIKLKFDENQKGYKIYRNEIEEAINLSEGEKTAIAFIYFVIKLKENGRKIQDCTLVIDDPISSFDSNKLFSAYAYMKSECEAAKQIFVLTHNYNFYSLILGWFNKKSEKVDGKKEPAFSLYRIENKIENEQRVALLCDGGESMKQATEYDYVFYTVYSMKDSTLSKKEIIFCGNVCRRLVESFLSFKFPKQRSDLAALLNVALPGKENDIVRERIYKFVNVYSHDKKINVFEELDTDILDGNSQMVINDILNMMQRLDRVHYDSMVDKIKNEL